MSPPRRVARADRALPAAIIARCHARIHRRDVPIGARARTGLPMLTSRSRRRRSDEPDHHARRARDVRRGRRLLVHGCAAEDVLGALSRPAGQRDPRLRLAAVRAGAARLVRAPGGAEARASAPAPAARAARRRDAHHLHLRAAQSVAGRGLFDLHGGAAADRDAGGADAGRTRRSRTLARDLRRPRRRDGDPAAFEQRPAGHRRPRGRRLGALLRDRRDHRAPADAHRPVRVDGVLVPRDHRAGLRGAGGAGLGADPAGPLGLDRRRRPARDDRPALHHRGVPLGARLDDRADRVHGPALGHGHRLGILDHQPVRDDARGRGTGHRSRALRRLAGAPSMKSIDRRGLLRFVAAGAALQGLGITQAAAQRSAAGTCARRHARRPGEPASRLPPHPLRRRRPPRVLVDERPPLRLRRQPDGAVLRHARRLLAPLPRARRRALRSGDGLGDVFHRSGERRAGRGLGEPRHRQDREVQLPRCPPSRRWCMPMPTAYRTRPTPPGMQHGQAARARPARTRRRRGLAARGNLDQGDPRDGRRHAHAESARHVHLLQRAAGRAARREAALRAGDRPLQRLQRLVATFRDGRRARRHRGALLGPQGRERSRRCQRTSCGSRAACTMPSPIRRARSAELAAPAGRPQRRPGAAPMNDMARQHADPPDPRPAPATTTPLAELGALAERHGIEAVWTSSLLGARDPFVAFVPLAQVTRKLRFGPIAVNPFDTHPARLAMSLLTLNELGNGRAQLVLGGGGEALEGIGLKPTRRVRRGARGPGLAARGRDRPACRFPRRALSHPRLRLRLGQRRAAAALDRRQRPADAGHGRRSRRRHHVQRPAADAAGAVDRHRAPPARARRAHRRTAVVQQLRRLARLRGRGQGARRSAALAGVPWPVPSLGLHDVHQRRRVRRDRGTPGGVLSLGLRRPAGRRPARIAARPPGRAPDAHLDTLPARPDAPSASDARRRAEPRGAAALPGRRALDRNHRQRDCATARRGHGRVPLNSAAPGRSKHQTTRTGDPSRLHGPSRAAREIPGRHPRRARRAPRTGGGAAAGGGRAPAGAARGIRLGVAARCGRVAPRHDGARTWFRGTDGLVAVTARASHRERCRRSSSGLGRGRG